MYNMLEKTSTNKIAQRVINQREEMYSIIVGTYTEFLPLIINYSGLEHHAISPIIVENLLRQGVGVAIGLTKDGNMALLGYVTKDRTTQYNGFTSYVTQPCKTGDIHFIIGKELRLPKYQEITYHDNYKSGNFVVLYNKPYTFVNDYRIINTYAERLAEISMSRFSIYMQSKVSHVIKGEVDDQDTEQIANDLFNGKPYIKTTDYFDEDNIIEINSVSDIISALPELKREYQNNLAELNALLGLNTLGVDKESGVSNIEAQSNQSFKKANESIYLKARNEPLQWLNKKYNTNIKAEYNDLMVSELSSLEKLQLNNN